VELLHDIHKYLNALYLYEEIVGGSWNGNLQGDQLTDFLDWYPRLNSKLEDRQKCVRDRLSGYLDELAVAKERKSSGQLMGGSSGFDNCLELMRKVGMRHFCKLEGIFNFECPVDQLYLMEGGAVVTTQKGKIYELRRSMEKEKLTWKTSALYQGELPQRNETDDQTRIICIGIEKKGEETVASFV
jgi:hypothetical protein